MLPPTGEHFRISRGGYAADITQGGAALRSVTYEGRELVSGFGPGEIPARCRGQHLMPWPNRIRDGRYSWQGQSQQLAISEPKLDNAIHGLVRWQPWLCVQHTSDTVVMAARLLAQTGYPWSLDLSITFTVSDNGLRVTQSAHNIGSGTAPYAHGSHPYLALPSGKADDWTLTVPASTRITSDERSLPVAAEAVAGTAYDFRAGKRIGDLKVDHCFTDIAFEDGRATASLSDGADTVSLWWDDLHPWVMVFTDDGAGPARRGVAIEPMTAPVDAFNSGEGVIALSPGESFSSSWGLCR